MRIIEKPIEEIRPYENNPRVNDRAVEKVAESIAQFGFKQPIVIDKDGVIVAGHTRLMAAKLLGLTKVPTISAADLTPEQVTAYRIADNKTGELAGWDFEKLDEELGSIDMDMSVFGFEIEQRDVTVALDSLESDPKDPEPKRIQCPLCGEWFEP